MSETVTEFADDNQPISIRRDRWLIIGGIVFCALIGWALLAILIRVHAASGVEIAALGPGMDVLVWGLGIVGFETIPGGFWGEICKAFAIGSTPQQGVWVWQEVLLSLIMWQVMALAMMLPTAATFIATYGDISSAARNKGLQQPSVSFFITGYLMVWGGFAFLATGIQWAISSGFTDIPVLINSTPVVGGGLLILSGLYQWSALKEACLSECRSPMRFFMNYWREGTTGALVMGARHGLYCVGCCWALMALMFVGGTMNLIWMAVLTVLMLLERILPSGRTFGRYAGGVLVVWGLMLLSTGFINF